MTLSGRFILGIAAAAVLAAIVIVVLATGKPTDIATDNATAPSPQRGHKNVRMTNDGLGIGLDAKPRPADSSR